MDSSPILRQQSQNKIQCEFQRMKNEHNKIPSHPKSFTPISVSQPFKQHSENKDPGNSEIARKAPVTPGISRLPVLAKSRCPQMPSDFSQSHCRWEEKPLAGKAKKKKPCTRPIPFNLSQSRSSRTANENLQRRAVLQPRTVAKVVQSVNNAHLKTSNTDVKSTKCPATLGSNVSSNKGAKMSTDNRSQLPGHSGPSSTFESLSHPLSSIPNNALSQNTTTTAQNVFNAEACVDNMNLLSLKDPTKTSHASQNTLPTVQGNLSKSATAVSSISDKGETFKLDHAALLSILRNEGVGATVLEPATPQSNAHNYLPQRVSVMKSRQKAVLATGPVRFVQFSPDSTTVQSILQNEGLKDGGLLSVTPKSSACPPGRSTSIYTAQRVPVKKNLAEVTGGPIAGELKETPLQKWTPQRVRSTRRQPMSAMKWHLSTQPSPYAGTPGLQSCKGSLHQCQEEVVQRLFDDQEDDQCKEVTEKDLETQGEQQPAQSALVINIHSPSEEEVETSADSNKEKKQMPVRLQPFIQAPERESVIFFSTGKKLLRGPRFEQQENYSNDEQQCSSEQRKVPSTHKETSEMSELTCQIKPPVPSLHRDSTAQKSCGLSSAVMMLRKRFPPLEELRMDEEVASYTSMTVSAAHGFLPPRPRCGNPLASALHFEETTRFVPVVPDPSESSPPSSPLQER